MFDTVRSDFNELQKQIDKHDSEAVKAIDKFDFVSLIQLQENLDDFAGMLKDFLQDNLQSKLASVLSHLLSKVTQAILQTAPGLYRETIIGALDLLTELRSDVLELSC